MFCMLLEFKPDINLGTLIEITVFGLSILGFAKKIGTLEAKLNIMYGWFKKRVIGAEGAEGEDEDFFG